MISFSEKIITDDKRRNVDIPSASAVMVLLGYATIIPQIPKNCKGMQGISVGKELIETSSPNRIIL